MGVSMRRRVLVGLVVSTAMAMSPAARAGGALVRLEAPAQGAWLPSALLVPEGYDPARAWPLVVFLHGSGECGDDGLAPSRVGLGPAMSQRPEAWPCLVLLPQKPSSAQEWEEHEDAVLAAIAAVRAAYNVDASRIALTGLSQGGHGTWLIGARHPGLFSCLVPVCGYGRPQTIASRVAGLPVWAFHGLRDDVVDPGETVAIVQELRRLRAARGADPDGARMTLYPGVGHDSWSAAYAEPDLPAWILGNSQPEARP